MYQLFTKAALLAATAACALGVLASADLASQLGYGYGDYGDPGPGYGDTNRAHHLQGFAHYGHVIGESDPRPNARFTASLYITNSPGTGYDRAALRVVLHQTLGNAMVDAVSPGVFDAAGQPVVPVRIDNNIAYGSGDNTLSFSFSGADGATYKVTMNAHDIRNYWYEVERASGGRNNNNKKRK